MTSGFADHRQDKQGEKKKNLSAILKNQGQIDRGLFLDKKGNKGVKKTNRDKNSIWTTILH